jgi:uncharacterized RDD family membrane protein YckC
MHCKSCGFANGEDDHRCLRCGRRIGVAVAAPAGYVGATALAAAPALAPQSKAQAIASTPPAQPSQAALFAPPLPKVIPFDQLQRQTATRTGVQETPSRSTHLQSAAPKASQQRIGRKPAAPIAQQGTLDFIPAASPKPRTLKTSVEAVIYCDRPVAAPMHRFVAAALDAAMILLGFGIFIIVFQALGGSLGGGKMFWITLGAAFALISLLYGVIWAITGGETAGMRWAELELITFDGFPMDARSRALRFAATWLSFCSGSLGLLWALADEENLTWHDHISKTFPTIREVSHTFVRQRR